MIIYKTTCLVNGKIYIGQDRNNNPRYFGSGTAFLQSMYKYGKHNFIKETLCICKTQTRLNFMEEFFINKFDATNKEIGYNILPGAGCNIGLYFSMSDEMKNRSVKKWKENWKNKSEEDKKRQARLQAKTVSITQRNFSKEKKKEIADKKAKSISEFYKTITPERRKEISDKMSEALKGRTTHMKGKRFSTNGKINKMVNPGEEPIKGFWFGMIYPTRL